jgi:hypothetical protein
MGLLVINYVIYYLDIVVLSTRQILFLEVVADQSCVAFGAF